MEWLYGMKEKCCCMILNYNDSDTVKQIVDHIYYYASFDYILIVDNCSSDESWNKILTYVDDRIIAVQTNYNGGYGYGNNYGIQYAKEILKCKFVLLSNPDVLFDENLVKGLLGAIRKPDSAIASAIQHDINDIPIKDVAWKIPTPIECALLQTGIGDKFFDTRYKEVLNSGGTLEVECVPGALLMIDVDKFVEVGGYDEKMFLYCEEDTIAFRLKAKGYKTLLLCDKHYQHAHAVSINKSIKDKAKQMKLIFENRIYFMERYLKAPKVIIYFAKCVHIWRLFQLKKALRLQL